MSKRGSQADNANKDRDWDKLWFAIWYNLMHVLGIVAVLGLVGWLAWAIFAPSQPRQLAVPEKPQYREVEKLQPRETDTSRYREAAQINFNRELLTAAKPCAKKTKNKSDVSSCSLFGLYLWMTPDNVKSVIDKSGYFSGKSLFVPKCSDNGSDCTEYISQSKDGVVLIVNFAHNSPDDKSTLSVDKITLVLSPAAIPYFDTDAMRTVFVKMFGPPDSVNNDDNLWGVGIKGGAKIWTYPSRSGEYWVIFERVK